MLALRALFVLSAVRIREVAREVRGFAPPAPAVLKVKRKTTASSARRFAPLPLKVEPSAADFKEGNEIISTDAGKHHDDSFILKDVESIMVEAPEEELARDDARRTRRQMFGKSSKAVENELDVSKDPLVNELRVMREMVNSCPEIWTYMNVLALDKKAIYDEHLCDDVVDLTYHQVCDAVRRSAAALSSLGIGRGDHVAVFGENSAHWLFADQGAQLAGAATVVRGADAPVDELRYIHDNSDAREVVVIQGPSLLKKLAKAAEDDDLPGIGFRNKHGPADTVVLMHREGLDDDDIASLAASLKLRVLCLADLMNRRPPMSPGRTPEISREDLATIVYTSGTTGRPKGVMLTHGNLLHQIALRFAPSRSYDESEPLPDDVMVTLLPVWHITERAAELCMFSRGCKLVYSSVKHLKSDLAIHRPHWMMLVPRVLEKISEGIQDKFSKKGRLARMMIHLFTMIASAKSKHSKIANGLVVAREKPSVLRRLYSRCVAAALTPLNALGHAIVWNKVKKALGGRQKLIMSGGSALFGKVEDFFEQCGVLLVVGYGLTECSPLLCHRRADSNLIAGGCVGHPVTDTEIRVVDVDAEAGGSDRDSLQPGQVGLVLARGKQVMSGYYNNKGATEKAIDRFGWFNTEDLGHINPATGDLFINGRAKDTIVLSNGENIEPSPIEDAMLRCKLIDQVVLAGQDKKRLGAIVVLNPQELSNEGLIEREEGELIQALVDIINDPHCSKEEYARASTELSNFTRKIKGDKAVLALVGDDVKQLLPKFRKWEQVGSFTFTFEPFAMANNLLTQSYKVKRSAVLEKYELE